jgi:hypothetical protein
LARSIGQSINGRSLKIVGKGAVAIATAPRSSMRKYKMID